MGSTSTSSSTIIELGHSRCYSVRLWDFNMMRGLKLFPCAAGRRRPHPELILLITKTPEAEITHQPLLLQMSQEATSVIGLWRFGSGLSRT